MKRSISVILAAVVLMAALPVSAHAAGTLSAPLYGCDIFRYSPKAALWLEDSLANGNRDARNGATLLYYLLWPGAKAVHWVRGLWQPQPAPHVCALCYSMLTSYTQGDFLEQNLLPGFQLYPPITDRDFWDSMARDFGPRLLSQGDAVLAGQPQPVTQEDVDRYRSIGEGVYLPIYYKLRKDLICLALAECVSGSGAYIDRALDYIRIICAEPHWAMPNARGTANAIDLVAAETAATLAGVLHLLTPVLGEAAETRIKTNMARRIFQSYLDHDANDFWWMTGKNNWNVWINSNVLFAALTLEDDQARKLAVIRKTMRSVDIFLRYYAAHMPDGACDEGPTYWDRAAGALGDYLEMLLVATGGALDKFKEPLVYNMGDYINKVYIGNGYKINYGDASANMSAPAGGIAYYLGKHIGNQALMDFAAVGLKSAGWVSERINPTVRGGSMRG